MVCARFIIHLRVIVWRVIMLSDMVCVCVCVFWLQVTKLMLMIMYNMVYVRFSIHLQVIMVIMLSDIIVCVRFITHLEVIIWRVSCYLILRCVH